MGCGELQEGPCGKAVCCQRQVFHSSPQCPLALVLITGWSLCNSKHPTTTCWFILPTLPSLKEHFRIHKLKISNTFGSTPSLSLDREEQGFKGKEEKRGQEWEATQVFTSDARTHST